MNSAPDTKIEMQQVNLTSNQLFVPFNEEERIKEALGSTSHYIRCLKCQYAGLTSVTRSCSCLNFFFSCCCFGCWFCQKSCKAKDINCYDAKHVCSKCGAAIGEYEAC